MDTRRPASRIHPKVSTMPRQRSESAQYLDIYKLTIEKKRLKQELVSLEKRRDRIQERLQAIEQQIESLEDTARRLRDPVNGSEPSSVVYPPIHSRVSRESDGFQTVTLEY